MADGVTPVAVFCCYSHADEVWLQKLESHLSPLKRQGLISFWHDRLIVPGTHWAETIDQHLETASVILLLVSSDFLASDYCYSVEMRRALAREEAGEARVVPILVRPVYWKETPFAHLQVLPTDAKPVASWQDQDTALTDVAAGIRRVVEDVPLLAASAPRAALPSIWNVPYPRNPFFLGRESELVQVHRHLLAGQVAALSQPQAISGLGGVGKSQVALEYAYRYHQDYQAVFWVRAESTEEFVSSYVSLAELLRLPEREEKDQQIIVAAVKRWLQAHRSWLLILDNADELALVIDFLPFTPGGHVLLTTRATATEGLARRLEIETFESAQGALLLLRRAGFIEPLAELSQASQEERDLAEKLSHELGGLPLALDQAGAYLEATGTNLADYWQLYQQHRTELLKERRGLVAYHPDPVVTTWSLSFQRVEEKNPAATELLRMLAFLSPDAIAEEILTAGASSLGPVLAPVAEDTFLLNPAIEALRAYSLIQRDRSRKMLSIHRLVQAVLQDRFSKEEQHTWRERAILAVNAAFPHVAPETWSQCERVLSQALLATQLIEQDQLRSEEAGRLLFETASYLRERARYGEAKLLFQRALYIYEQRSGPEHSSVADPLHGLANLYFQQGKYAEAEPLFQRALHIYEQPGPEHVSLAHLLNNLANLYFQQGKYAEAEPLFQRALYIYEQKLGQENVDMAYPLNGLANLYKNQGKDSEAELLYERALHIREQQLGPEHALVAYPLNGLANLYSQQGKNAQAEPLYERALHIWEQQLGPEHDLVAHPLTNLAELYFQQGKYAEAELLFQRALHIYEQQLGSEHDSLAYPLHGLAELYFQQGKYVEAEPLYERALYIFERQLGPEYILVAYPLNGLASLYFQQGKYAEAERLFRRALHIFEQQLGPEHAPVAYPLNGLASLYSQQGKYAEAEPLYERALHIREQQLGPQHPETAETIHGLARFWETQGNSEKARAWYARALAVREQALGRHHPKTTETRICFIALLHAMGQHEVAAQLEIGLFEEERREEE